MNNHCDSAFLWLFMCSREMMSFDCVLYYIYDAFQPVIVSLSSVKFRLNVSAVITHVCRTKSKSGVVVKHQRTFVVLKPHQK